MTSSALAGLSVTFDPLRDKSYRESALGPHVVNFLAWMEIGQAAEETLDSYERNLSRACLMYPKVSLEAFGIEPLLHVAKSFPAKSRRTRLTAYRSFFRWADLFDLLPNGDPCRKLPAIKEDRQKVYDVFRDPEIAALTALPLLDGALCQVLFDTGIRKAEARKSALSSFIPDPAPGQLHIQGKGRKDRLIPVSLAVSMRLAEAALIEGLDAVDHLWYTRKTNRFGSRIHREKPIANTSFDRWWRGCCKAAGVRYRNVHLTRHTYATRYLQNGGSIDRLSRLLGHESIKTTDETYSHLTTVDLAAEVDEVFARIMQATVLEIPETA